MMFDRISSSPPAGSFELSYRDGAIQPNDWGRTSMKSPGPDFHFLIIYFGDPTTGENIEPRFSPRRAKVRGCNASA
jgi:hypothetical protein